MSNPKSLNKAHAKRMLDHLSRVLEDRAESAVVPFSGISGATQMNLLLDVLLTDTWSMALRKVALATAAARPDIKFTIDGMRQLTQWHPEHSRERCRWYVRRLRHDENNLDLLWLMLAASPTQPWTIGFMDRLGDAYAKMEGELTPPA